jgi:hypothetical protein
MLVLSVPAATGIAFVSALDLGNNANAGGNFSVAFPVSSGSNRGLFVFFDGDLIGGNDDISSVTYAGTAMTLVSKSATLNTAVNRIAYVYYLINPAAGSNNVVISSPTTKYILAGAAEYTGVNQTTLIDGAANAALATATTQPLSWTTANAGWQIAFTSTSATATQIYSANNGYVLRALGVQYNDWGFYDSNGPKVAGSQAVTLSVTGANVVWNSVASGFRS